MPEPQRHRRRPRPARREGPQGAADGKGRVGGTFTISNHGVSGSLFAAPIIINQPQSAILGVGKLEKRVVVREVDGADTIQIRPLAYVSLTIDHRVVDGHQTNAWLTRFVDILESWPVE
jgi:2-oxoglutarate dehydrogenase E2 component (dihydrolipoamide succinyltransferase)